MLCGSKWNVELRETEMLQNQIKMLYLPGPFIYSQVLKITTDFQLCCSHCLNHIRKRKNKKRKHLLPMDQYLLGLLHVQYLNNLDKRSIKRLKRNLTSNQSFYNITQYAPLAYLLKASCINEEWMKINLNTNFFSHYAIAKQMRYERMRL